VQKLKNIEDVVAQLKPLLRTYLEEHDTEFKGPLMTCPNREAHANEDRKPSAGFVPNTDETVWHCFSCSNSGDIFTAYSFLEGKPVQGEGWYVALKALADKYQVAYEVEPLSVEEQEQTNVQQFLQELVKLANSHLIQMSKGPVWEYLESRGWVEGIRFFKMGYVERTKIFEDFFRDYFGKYPEIAKYISIHPDLLYNRLIYPVSHRHGLVLGLITRSLTDEDESIKYRKHFLKYLEKGGILYNLTKNYKTVYVVEGASSVFTMHKYGIQNVVAMLGKIFTVQMYNALVRNGVNRVIFCFDGDEPGQAGMENALTLTQDKSDIKILIKTLPKDKDPDEIIRESGVESFKEIPEVSNFKFQLDRLKTATDSTYANYKKSVFDILTSFPDSLVQDKMTKMFTEEMNVSKAAFSEELQRFKSTKGVVADVSAAEILAEENHLLKSIETFEEDSLRCGKLRGIPFGFPMLEERLDGLQQGLILIAGKWNCGKSAFLHTLALNLLQNASNYVLYFSIDDSVTGTTVPRMISNLAQVSINTISNPLHRIDGNETIDAAEKLLLRNRRNEAIELMKSYSGRLGLKDATDGFDTEFIERTIRVYRSIAKERNLVIIVDFLNMVKWSKNVDRTEQETQLAFFFKSMSNIYRCPVVCTAETGKGVADRTREVDIKGSSTLQFRSTLTLLLSSDFETDGDEGKSEMYFYDEKGVAQPVVRVSVSKNKGSSFRKALFYKFYRDQSKFIECTTEEQDEYRRKFK
jgi:DNA primase